MSYYKLVRAVDNKLVSSMAKWLDEELVTEYIPGQWVSSQYGPLFLYDNIESEKVTTTTQIWRVDAKNARQQHFILFPVGFSPEVCREFWQTDKQGSYRNSNCNSLYLNRVLICDAIKLVERIV